MSRFSRTRKCSIRNPCGLLSERTEFCSEQLVTKLRSVTLLCRIQHQRLPLVQYVHLLTLLLSKAVRSVDRIATDRYADYRKDDSVEPNLLERGLYVCE